MQVGDSAGLILVLEADAAVRDSLRFVLGMAGLNVRTHADLPALLGDAGLTAAACLLIGHHPPKLDGFAAVSRLQAVGAAAPAILMVDHATPAMQRKAVRMGIWQVIERPVFDNSLMEGIHRILAQPARSAGPAIGLT